MIKMDYETYNCTLETKSPVIVAAGSEYQYGPQEYIFIKGKLNGNLVDLVKKIDITKYYKSLDEDKKEELLSNLLNSNFNLDEYSKSNTDIKKYGYYSSVYRCNINPKKEIMEHIKTMNKLYIPGSSLKGALTTAILYDKIHTDDVKKIMKNKKYRDRDNAYKNVLKNYFSSKKGNSAQKNIMRFIQISDTNLLKIPRIYDIQSIQVKPNHTYEYYKRGGIVTTYYETIEQNSKLNCDITIKKDKEILNQLNLKEKGKILDIDYIKDVLYNFSMDYIEYEQDFIDTYNIDFLKDYYKQLAKENTPDSPLIRVGLGSGFMQTTVNMKTKNEDPMLYKKVQKIAHKNTYDYEFPKSRKITAKTKKPLGWIKLTFDKK